MVKSASSPTFPVAAPFKWDQTSASFNAVGVKNINDLSLTINNNLEAQFALCASSYPVRVKRSGMQIIEISGTVDFDSQSYMAAFEAGSELPVVINFASGEAPHSLKIDIPKFRFKTFEPTISGPGQLSASFTAGAMFSVDSNTAIEFTLVNTQTYY